MAAIVLLRGRLGVVSAAVGVAAGSVLMVAAQLHSFLRRVGLPRRFRFRLSAVTLAAVAPIAVFTVTRQAQVFIERFLGSSLEPGTISHLNYAQKVAQVPMVLALVLTAVTFPALARSMSARDDAGARSRIRADLRLIGGAVLLAVAYLIAFAPAVVSTLFQRGRFSAADVAATVVILRVYLLGLLGHALVGALSRSFFSGAQTWYPAAAMAAGLGLNAVLAAALVGPWGAAGIAAANAAGITLTAVLLLVRLGRWIPGLPPGRTALSIGRLAIAAAGATAVGWWVYERLAGTGIAAPLIAAAGALVVGLAFVALATVTARDEVRAAATQLAREVRRGRT
jgi:putative peptidoglycan lipid II flippase